MLGLPHDSPIGGSTLIALVVAIGRAARVTNEMGIFVVKSPNGM